MKAASLSGGTPIEDMTDETRRSDVIPRSYRARIAEAVLAFARLEHAMAEAVRCYLHLTEHEGRIYTDIGFSNLHKLTRSLLRQPHDQQAFDIATSHIFPAMIDLAEDRNLLVHGQIFLWDGQFLVAASRRPADDPTTTQGKYFSKPYLDLLVEKSFHLTGLFLDVARLYHRNTQHLPQVPVVDRTRAGLKDHRAEVLGKRRRC